MRAETVRDEITRLMRVAPFKPFVLSLENQDRVTVAHPANIAFDPDGDATDFYVISGRVRLFGTFDAVTSVGSLETIEQLG